MKTGNDLLVLIREKTVNFARMSKFEIKMYLSTTNEYLKYSIWNPRLFVLYHAMPFERKKYNFLLRLYCIADL